MTVSRATALLFTFRSRIEEAVCLVPRMCPEEKLKAVHFWNLISEKLQDIVNNSAADINAVAFKMNETESEKFNLELGHSTLGAVPQNSSLSPDFLSMTSGYSMPNDINSSPLKQLFSSEVPFTTPEHPSASEISSIPHINGEMDMPKSDTQDVCDQLLELANISSNSCDTFTRNAQTLTEIPLANEHQDAYSSSAAKAAEPVRNCPRQQPIRKAKSRNCDDNFYCDMEIVPGDLSLDKNQNSTSQNRKSKLSSKKNKTTQSETDGKYLGDSSVSQNPNDLSFCKTNSSLVSSFPSSNSEEILDNNSPDMENSGKASTSNKTDFTCKSCEISYLNQMELNSHLWKFHRSFKCPDCAAVLITKRNLVVHMRKHTGEKPYVCGQCNVGFTTHGNLKRHMNTHKGEKPWRCEECDTRFTEKKSLTIHMRKHTGERPYLCKVCGKGFSQSGILQTHLAMHLDIKVHLCELCGKSFRQKSQLRMHKLRHANIRKFGCDTCSAVFLTRGDLDRHARKHTGEKPYVCKVCSKSFTRQQSLNEHLNRHYGLKPYACNHCGKKFAEMSSCYKHIKQHPQPNSPSDVQENQERAAIQEYPVPLKPSAPVTEAGNVENELPNLEGQQYYAVVLNTPKETCELDQSENNQTIVFNPGNEENGFGVLTTINFLNVSSLPQTFSNNCC